jgi:hypothetical protein
MSDHRTGSHGPLQRHIAGAYFSLRVGISGIAFALPLLLWLGGLARGLDTLLPSMSQYYYSPVRDVFVGALCAIGVFLFLYKGFSHAENWALNLAGILVIGVAMFPTADKAVPGSGDPSIHVPLAVAFFICIAYVCIFRAGDTLSLIRDTRRAARLQLLYRVLGAAMVVAPLAAIGVARLMAPPGTLPRSVFAIEAAGVWVFAAYWLAKSLEIRETDAERLALAGKLRETSGPGAGGTPGKLVQVEP